MRCSLKQHSNSPTSMQIYAEGVGTTIYSIRTLHRWRAVLLQVAWCCLGIMHPPAQGRDELHGIDIPCSTMRCGAMWAKLKWLMEAQAFISKINGSLTFCGTPLTT